MEVTIWWKQGLNEFTRFCEWSHSLSAVPDQGVNLNLIIISPFIYRISNSSSWNTAQKNFPLSVLHIYAQLFEHTKQIEIWTNLIAQYWYYLQRNHTLRFPICPSVVPRSPISHDLSLAKMPSSVPSSSSSSSSFRHAPIPAVCGMDVRLFPIGGNRHDYELRFELIGLMRFHPCFDLFLRFLLEFCCYSPRFFLREFPSACLQAWKVFPNGKISLIIPSNFSKPDCYRGIVSVFLGHWKLYSQIARFSYFLTVFSLKTRFNLTRHTQKPARSPPVPPPRPPPLLPPAPPTLGGFHGVLLHVDCVLEMEAKGVRMALLFFDFIAKELLSVDIFRIFCPNSNLEIKILHMVRFMFWYV